MCVCLLQRVHGIQSFTLVIQRQSHFETRAAIQMDFSVLTLERTTSSERWERKKQTRFLWRKYEFCWPHRTLCHCSKWLLCAKYLILLVHRYGLVVSYVCIFYLFMHTYIKNSHVIIQLAKLLVSSLRKTNKQTKKDTEHNKPRN